MKLINIVVILLQINFAISEDVIFHLFTQDNPDLPETIDEYWEPGDSSGALEYKFIIHGFIGKAQNDWVLDTKDTYLKKAQYPYNIIVVDWSKISGNQLWDYSKIKLNLNEVAIKVVALIDHILSRGVDLEYMHIIGFSLGSHIAGIVGRIIRASRHGMPIRRITGLDPAHPGIPENELLNKKDASFVDVIHTSPLGVKKPCGHVDFYVWNGEYQKGCLENYLDDIIDKDIPKEHKRILCSHRRACSYFVESIISGDFYAIECDNNYDYECGNCNGNQIIRMGEHCDEQARGTFYLQTNRKPPFAKKYNETENEQIMCVQ